MIRNVPTHQIVLGLHWSVCPEPVLANEGGCFSIIESGDQKKRSWSHRRYDPGPVGDW